MNTEENNKSLIVKTHWGAYLTILIVLGFPLFLLLMSEPSSTLYIMIIIFSVFMIVSLLFIHANINITPKEFIYKHWPLKNKIIPLNRLRRVEIQSGSPRNNEPYGANGTLRLDLYDTDENIFVINFTMFDDKRLIDIVKYLAYFVPNLEMNDRAKEAQSSDLKKVRFESLGTIIIWMILITIFSSVVVLLRAFL